MENLTGDEDFVMGDVEVKIEIKEEIKEEVEDEPETEKSVEEKEQLLFVLAQAPQVNFYEEESDDFNYEEESNNQNPVFDVSCYGDNNIKYEQDPCSEDEDDFDEYQDPLAQLDTLHDDNDNEEEDILIQLKKLKQKHSQMKNQSHASAKIKSRTPTGRIKREPRLMQAKLKIMKFTCQYCPAHFPSYEELIEHEKPPHEPKKMRKNAKGAMRYIRKSRPCQCLLCFIWTPGEVELKRHLRLHAGPSPHSCPCCSFNVQQQQPSLKAEEAEAKTTTSTIFSSTSFEEWLKHVNENHSDRLVFEKPFQPPPIPLPFICYRKHCFEQFENMRDLREHDNSCHTKRSYQRQFLLKYKCTHPGCNAAFCRNNTFQIHLKTAHKTKSANLLPCGEPGCSRLCRTEATREYHLKFDHGEKISFRCPKKDCSTEFFTQQSFDNHTRAHILPPPVTWGFLCTDCFPHRPFPTESSRQEHVQLQHAHPCPFNLPECPRTFHSYFLRDIHMLDKHQHNSPDIFTKYPTLSTASSFLRCNHGNCSVQFKTFTALKTHIRMKKHKMHTFTCPASSCTYSTRRWGCFHFHFKPHPLHDPCNPDFQPDENPWSCPICQNSDECQSPSSLQQHALAQHNFLNFPCPFVCPENLKNNDSQRQNQPMPMKCGMIFDNFNQLHLHWKRYSAHFPQDPKLWLDWLKTPIPIKCSQENCPEEFMSQSEMKAHSSSHFSSKEKNKKPKLTPSKPTQDPKNKDQGNEQKEQADQPQITKRKRAPRKLDYEDIVKTKS